MNLNLRILVLDSNKSFVTRIKSVNIIGKKSCFQFQKTTMEHIYSKPPFYIAVLCLKLNKEYFLHNQEPTFIELFGTMWTSSDHCPYYRKNGQECRGILKKINENSTRSK